MLLSSAFFCRDEISLLPIHRKQIRNDLPGYRKRRPVVVSFLSLEVLENGELLALYRRELGGYYERTLDMLVALLREQHTRRLLAELRSFLESPQ